MIKTIATVIKIRASFSNTMMLSSIFIEKNLCIGEFLKFYHIMNPNSMRK